MSTRFYDTDLADAAWAFVAPVLGRAAGWATSHYRPSCRPQRHLLPFADRLPMATIATRISTLGHGLPLLSGLAKCRCVGSSYTACSTSRPVAMWVERPVLRWSLGWPIGQDHRAWWYAWFRRVQASHGRQTSHPS